MSDLFTNILSHNTGQLSHAGMTYGITKQDAARNMRRVPTILHRRHLDSPVFAAPLERLEGLWEVKFGHKWVTQAEICEASENAALNVMAALSEEGTLDFWTLCYNRLRGAGRLELISIGGEPEPVVRLIVRDNANT